MAWLVKAPSVLLAELQSLSTLCPLPSLTLTALLPRNATFPLAHYLSQEYFLQSAGFVCVVSCGTPNIEKNTGCIVGDQQIFVE